MFKDQTKPYITASEIEELCRKLGAQIQKDYTGKDLVVVAILKGSILFAADLIRHIDLPLTIDFVRLSSYGSGTESSGNVKIIKDISCNLKGKHVLIAEDILDTGHTLRFLCQHILVSQPASLKVCTLLDKPSRRRVEVKSDYCGRAIEDRFVVGYGLDYQEKCRNYPEISYLPSDS